MRPERKLSHPKCLVGANAHDEEIRRPAAACRHRVEASSREFSDRRRARSGMDAIPVAFQFQLWRLVSGRHRLRYEEARRGGGLCASPASLGECAEYTKRASERAERSSRIPANQHRHSMHSIESADYCPHRGPEMTRCQQSG